MIKKMLLFCLVVVTLLLIACDTRTPDEVAADEEVFGQESSLAGAAVQVATLNRSIIRANSTSRSTSAYDGCWDPDEKNPNITGITTVNVTTGLQPGKSIVKTYKYTDKCANPYNVTEYYCSNTKRLAKATIACPLGCFNGSCVSCIDADSDGFGVYCANGADCNDNNASIKPGATEFCNDAVDNNCNGQVNEGGVSCLGSCVDSDNGFNLSSRGIVNGLDVRGVAFNYEDTCTVMPASNTPALREYTCSSGSASSSLNACACQNGACPQSQQFCYYLQPNGTDFTRQPAGTILNYFGYHGIETQQGRFLTTCSSDAASRNGYACNLPNSPLRSGPNSTKSQSIIYINSCQYGCNSTTGSCCASTTAQQYCAPDGSIHLARSTQCGGVIKVSTCSQGCNVNSSGTPVCCRNTQLLSESCEGNTVVNVSATSCGTTYRQEVDCTQPSGNRTCYVAPTSSVDWTFKGTQCQTCGWALCEKMGNGTTQTTLGYNKTHCGTGYTKTGVISGPGCS